MKSGNEGCRGFRAALSRALEGLPVPEELTRLSWHEHLLACEKCRLLLEREEVLEELLATLPEPKLPPDLTRKVLARLGATGRLDRLLEMADAAPPDGLAGRISAGVRKERALDRLLDLDVVAVPSDLAARVRSGVALDRLLDLDVEPVTPAGLAPRIIEALEPERRPRHSFRLLRSPVFYAAAAGFVFIALSLALWQKLDKSIEPEDRGPIAIDGKEEEPDPALLAALDLLEPDQLWRETEGGAQVTDSAEDLHLFLSDSLDVDDEVLLAFLEGE
jgi:hypothetical protein